MKKTVFLSMMACIASFLFAGCDNDTEETSQKEEPTKVTVTYSFEKSDDLHDAVEAEINYYDLETGVIITETMPATINGESRISLDNNKSLTCGFKVKFKKNEDFVVENGKTYNTKFSYNLEVFVEQPGKNALMWSEEETCFPYPEIEADEMNNIIDEVITETKIATGCVIVKENDTYLIYDKSNNISELFN